MAITLDQTIAQRQQSWKTTLFASQTFWVLIVGHPLCLLFLYLTTNAFATTKNLYNITRNVTFVAIIALGMTLVIITGGIDLSVGSVLCLCSMVLGGHHACRLQHRGRHRGGDRHRAAVGAFNGVLIAYLGFPPFVVTLGMLSIARSLAWSRRTTQSSSSSGPTTTSCWRSAAAPGSSASPTRCST